MRVFHNYTFISVLSFLHATSAYFIDDDCNPQQKEFLHRAIDNAAQLNNYAMATAGSPSQPAQQQLMEWIFGTDPGTRQRLGVTLNAISTVFTRHETVDQLGQIDFHVYCTTKRYKSTMTKNGLKWFDPDMGENWRFRTIFNCEVATAYTTTPKKTDTPSAIQICPWFLDYVMGKDPAFQNEIKPDVMAKLSVSLREFIAHSKYADIDFFALFDKVMLHEITHTRGGGSAVDVEGFNGYGWKNARRLSTTVTSTDINGPRVDGPERNSDSLAVFASACRMIIDGITINEDGTFTEPAATRIKRVIAAMRTRSIFGFR